MTMAYSAESKAAVLAAIDGGASVADVAKTKGISEDLVARWHAVHARASRLPRAERRKAGGGRKPKLDATDLAFISGRVKEFPATTLVEFVALLSAETGKTVTVATIGKALNELGYEKVKPVKVASTPAPQTPPRYGPEHRREPVEGKYPSSLTDAEWRFLEPLWSAARDPRGRKPTHDRRLMLDAILLPGSNRLPMAHVAIQLSVVESGVEHLSPITRFRSVEAHLRSDVQAVAAGIRPRSITIRRHRGQSDRQDDGRRGPCGYDAGKKIKGRKRHLVVDVLGMPCGILIHEADKQDRDGGLDVIALAVAKYPTLQKIWADGGYAGQCIVKAREQSSIDLEIVKRSDEGSGALWQQQGEDPPVSTGFKVVKWRWLVERTFGWICRHRRMSKDYEETIESSMACLRLALIWLLTRRMGAAAI